MVSMNTVFFLAPRRHLNYWGSNLISGFHRALLQSVTFISRLNALDYTKLGS